MRAANQYITPELLAWIKEELGEKSEGENPQYLGYVHEVYKGYISSMGASIIQSGLIPTLAFYSENKPEGKAGRGEKPKAPLLRILEKMLAARYSGLTSKGLFLLALDLKGQPDELRRLQKDLVNATVALKLALRTFELKKPEKNESE